MKILINDLLQFSNLPDALKSPGLDDRVPYTGPIQISFSIPAQYSTFEVIDGILSQPGWNTVFGTFIDGVLSQSLIASPVLVSGVPSQSIQVLGSDQFDCLGIGGTDATQITLNGEIVINSPTGRAFEKGLYEIGQSVTAGTLVIEHNGTYMGRIAAGTCREMCIRPSREPGFYTNLKTRESLSGVVLPTAGGYGGKEINVDFRYTVDRDIYTDFERAYVTQIMRGYPFFLSFENDDWLPYDKFYGQTDNEILFQSSVNFFKYSRKFQFLEKF